VTRLIIVGQNLNASGSRRTAQALQFRDSRAISEIARRQAAFGADMLDVCASGIADEIGALAWLVQTIQEAVDVPLSLDTADPAVVRRILPLCRRAPWLNVDFSDLPPQSDDMIALLRDNPALPVVAACRDSSRIDLSVDHRLTVAQRLALELRGYGFAASQIVFDPIMLPASAGPVTFAATLDTIILLRRQFPESRILCAVGNYSYGLRAKRTAENFCAEAARSAGADVFLCDPANIAWR
jgi:cobalamin-dependent methionine synthase I